MADDLRQRIADAIAGHWPVTPNNDGTVMCHCGDRVKADRERQAFREHTADAVLRLVQPELDQLRAELDRTRAELAKARARLASYGTPIKQFPPLPPDDETHAKKAALRAELERTGTTEWAHADGRGLCPERDHCPSGLLALFVLTKRGRLPVHGNDYHRCDGSGQKPAVVLRLPDPAAVSAPTTT